MSTVTVLLLNIILSIYTVPMVSFDFYKPSFLSRFIESHIVMAEVRTTKNLLI